MIFRGTLGIDRARTFNRLARVVMESGTPEEVWSDIYLDIEVMRWGFISGLSVWIRDTCRATPMIDILTSHPEIADELEQS